MILLMGLKGYNSLNITDLIKRIEKVIIKVRKIAIHLNGVFTL